MKSNNKTKMNALYKTAFIFLLICVALLAAGAVTAYLFERPVFSAVFTGFGVLLAFAAIILALLSSPKAKNEISDEQTVDK